MDFAPSFFEHLSDRLELAVYDINQEHRMSLKLQGIAAKMAMLQHNVDADADKLAQAIDAADAKRQVVMPKAVATVAKTSGQLADVEAFMTSIEATTNGAPADPAAATVNPSYPTYP